MTIVGPSEVPTFQQCETAGADPPFLKQAHAALSFTGFQLTSRAWQPFGMTGSRDLPSLCAKTRPSDTCSGRPTFLFALHMRGSALGPRTRFVLSQAQQGILRAGNSCASLCICVPSQRLTLGSPILSLDGASAAAVATASSLPIMLGIVRTICRIVR